MKEIYVFLENPCLTKSCNCIITIIWLKTFENIVIPYVAKRKLLNLSNIFRYYQSLETATPMGTINVNKIPNRIAVIV